MACRVMRAKPAIALCTNGCARVERRTAALPRRKRGSAACCGGEETPHDYLCTHRTVAAAPRCIVGSALHPERISTDETWPTR